MYKTCIFSRLMALFRRPFANVAYAPAVSFQELPHRVCT